MEVERAAPKRPRFSGAARKRLSRLLQSGVDYDMAVKTILRQKKGQHERSQTFSANNSSHREVKNEITQGSSQSGTKGEIIKVCITHSDYPRHLIDNAKLKILQQAVMDAVEKIPEEGPQVRFQDCTIKPGWLVLTCADQESYKWLIEKAKHLQPWEGARLKTIEESKLPKTYVCVAYIPDDVKGKKLTSDKVFTRLKKMNHGLPTHNWRVLKCEKSGLGHTWTFSVDEVSMKALKCMNYKPYFGFGQIDFKPRARQDSRKGTHLRSALSTSSDVKRPGKSKDDLHQQSKSHKTEKTYESTTSRKDLAGTSQRSPQRGRTKSPQQIYSFHRSRTDLNLSLARENSRTSLQEPVRTRSPLGNYPSRGSISSGNRNLYRSPKRDRARSPQSNSPSHWRMTVRNSSPAMPDSSRSLQRDRARSPLPNIRRRAVRNSSPVQRNSTRSLQSNRLRREGRSLSPAHRKSPQHNRGRSPQPNYSSQWKRTGRSPLPAKRHSRESLQQVRANSPQRNYGPSRTKVGRSSSSAHRNSGKTLQQDREKSPLYDSSSLIAAGRSSGRWPQEDRTTNSLFNYSSLYRAPDYSWLLAQDDSQYSLPEDRERNQQYTDSSTYWNASDSTWSAAPRTSWERV